MVEQLEVIKTSCLPPRDVRLVSEDFKIETPVDDRGLIDVTKLISEVKDTIDPDYQWPTVGTNVHHFYWPAAEYPHVQKHDEGVNTALFRNQPTNKGLMPIFFHNWLHRVSIPPPIPDNEIIKYQMEAWNVTRSLFHSVKNARHWQRRVQRSMNVQNIEDYKDGARDEIDIEIIEGIMDKHFVGVDACREQLSTVHPEFQIINPDEPFDSLVRNLGKIMAPSSIILTRTVAA